MNIACANPGCQSELKYLRGGRLFLMEREPSVADRFSVGPSKRTVTMRRYFWLCESCAQTYLIRRWTEAGIELVLRHPMKSIPASSAVQAHDWVLPGLVG